MNRRFVAIPLFVALAHGPLATAGSMADMQGGRMQGGSPPADARDPHAYAEGQDFGPLPRLRLADEKAFASLRVEQLEWVHTRDNGSAAFDLQGWFGRDYDRAVLKSEGEHDGGRLQDVRTELLWGHAFAAFWDTQLGWRHDSGTGPGRDWLAFGVQGLAPYWFEVDVTGYLGESGRSAARVDLSYELLLSQRLVLTPRLEANLYGRDDPARGLGSGLADLTAGLRLRYEIRREFAPYVGVEWTGLYGDTADLARAEGEDTRTTALVAGLRFWF